LFLILIDAAAVMSYRSRRAAINPDNVNAKWKGGLAPADRERSRRRAVRRLGESAVGRGGEEPTDACAGCLS
jgi:hypothetical protein